MSKLTLYVGQLYLFFFYFFIALDVQYSLSFSFMDCYGIIPGGKICFYKKAL